nr:GNAT family N-acetyltransferase [uncultured Psychroserpens sp.]
MKVIHHKQNNKGKFSLVDDGQEIGEMTYKYVSKDTIDINHTLIDKAYRGKDLGLLLIEQAVKYLRTNELKAIPSCPYVDKVFRENSKYSDLIA